MAAPVQDKRVDVLKHAREAQQAKLIRKIDPDGTLAAGDPDELARRVADARKSRYTEMARASHEARRRNRARREALNAAEIAAAAVLNAYAKAGS